GFPDQPSDPHLWPWGRARSVEDGWSLKRLHGRVLLSATYQRAARVAGGGWRVAAEEPSSPATRHPPPATQADPENRWLGRFTPRRLEAEEIRDAMLSAAGRLDRTPGGPATHDLNGPRRSLYVQTARFDRSNYATLFDAANPDASVEKRDVSTVSPQALFLLNHSFVLTQAKH